MPSNKDRSFNDAMNEWAAKQSFFQNTRNRIVHPDPSLPLAFRMIGYLFRLGIVALLALVIFLFALKKYLNGDGFGQMMAEKIAAVIKADEYEGRSYYWKGSRATTKIFTATGSDEAIFKELTAQGISFSMPRLRLFRKKWNLDEIDIATLDMLLRVGRKTELAPLGSATVTGAPLLAAGYGINPDLNRIWFDRIEIGDGNFRWGVSDTTKGSIMNAPMEVTRDPGGWNLRFSGGTLSQNWWRNVAIDSLDVRTDDEKITFSEGSLSLSHGGQATLAGSISLEAAPQVNLQMSLTDTRLESLLPPAFHRFVGGTGSASVAISGSPNARTGLASEVTLEIEEGRLRNIAVFEALSLLLESTRVRQLPITSGIIEFHTGNGSWRVTKIEIESDEMRLRGSFSVTAGEEPAPATGVEAINAGEIDGSSEVPITERWEFSGRLQFGVPTAKVGDAHRLAPDFFKADGSGMSWIEIPLDGPITEMTQAQHDKIILAMKDS